MLFSLVVRLGVFASLVSSAAQASTLPLNHLHLEDNPKVIYRISPTDFKRIVNEIVGTFSPFARMHGAELKANLLWNNGDVNAVAYRDGNLWSIDMYGGLARRKEVTPDAFALVVCHELGHHFGGYPFKRSNLDGNAWAASEGQADYFSTQVCARMVWKRDREENAAHRLTVDRVAKEACDRAWKYQMDRDLCYRTADAGQSLATLMNVLEGARRPVRYAMPRRLQVPSTQVNHPAAQCRLETYLNGAICKRMPDLRNIPGLHIHLGDGSGLDEEKEAARSSCEEMGSFYDGSRPRCWFQPQLSSW